MTNWQWQVILALCRLVLGMLPNEFAITPEQANKDLDLLKEALDREKNNGPNEN